MIYFKINGQYSPINQGPGKCQFDQKEGPQNHIGYGEQIYLVHRRPAKASDETWQSKNY